VHIFAINEITPAIDKHSFKSFNTLRERHQKVNRKFRRIVKAAFLNRFMSFEKLASAAVY